MLQYVELNAFSGVKYIACCQYVHSKSIPSCDCNNPRMALLSPIQKVLYTQVSMHWLYWDQCTGNCKIKLPFSNSSENRHSGSYSRPQCWAELWPHGNLTPSQSYCTAHESEQLSAFWYQQSLACSVRNQGYKTESTPCISHIIHSKKVMEDYFSVTMINLSNNAD